METNKVNFLLSFILPHAPISTRSKMSSKFYMVHHIACGPTPLHRLQGWALPVLPHGFAEPQFPHCVGGPREDLMDIIVS